MARVHHRRAAKDYPDHGIKKGDMYYTANIKTGPYSSRTIRQLTPIKRSQLTTSPFLGTLYDIEERLPDVGDTDEVEAIAAEIRELGEAAQESLDNMPEGLQQGDTGQMLQERIDGCEQWASDLESALHDLDEEEYDEADDDQRAAMIQEAIGNVDHSIP